MADSLVEKTLLTEALSFLGGLGFAAEDIASENVSFNPEGKPKWAVAHYMPNIPQPTTIGVGGQDRETGVFQIDFNIPQGKGSGQFRDWIDAARAKFVAGATFKLGDFIASGAGTDVVNGFYDQDIDINSRPSFLNGVVRLSFSPFPASWRFNNNGNYYVANGDVPTPDLATGWFSSQLGEDPVPVVKKVPVVTITACGGTAGRNVDNFFRKSVSIAYRAELTRSPI